MTPWTWTICISSCRSICLVRMYFLYHSQVLIQGGWHWHLQGVFKAFHFILFWCYGFSFINTKYEYIALHFFAEPVILMVPAGPKQLCPFPFIGKLEFNPMNHFMGLLTCFLQAHAVRWDISLILPALPSTMSASMSTLVWVFGQLLGYDAEVIHMYKELGGHELVMWRRIEDGGATTWEPRFVSPILHSNGQTDDLS